MYARNAAAAEIRNASFIGYKNMVIESDIHRVMHFWQMNFKSVCSSYFIPIEVEMDDRTHPNKKNVIIS